MGDFIGLLLAASEKAANIARRIRSEEQLFQLLIEEKCNEDKNQRFIHDFKTLADVLIQECVRYEISLVFPQLAENIYGEENNTFTNSLGETIQVKIVQDSVQRTSELLAKVLNRNVAAAKLLAEEVHRKIPLNKEQISTIPNDEDLISYSNIGIWIDPIDGTNEYIVGSTEYDNKVVENEDDVIWPTGLHCVTVLIGAFELDTGKPIVGVLNQPFWKFDSVSKEWKGRNFWSLCTKNYSFSSLKYVTKARERKTIILSSTESKTIISKLKQEFDLVYSCGAGYKFLCVILGLADGYVLTKSSTHYWDACCPHAILNSLDGRVIDLAQAISNTTHETNVDKIQELSYELTKPGAKECHFANQGGLLAFVDSKSATEILKCLQQ